MQIISKNTILELKIYTEEWWSKSLLIILIYNKMIIFEIAIAFCLSILLSINKNIYEYVIADKILCVSISFNFCVLISWP